MKSALVLPVCVALMFAATPASGSELVISTGKQGGSYHGIGLRLASARLLESPAGRRLIPAGILVGRAVPTPRIQSLRAR